jgi:hypothetical protein
MSQEDMTGKENTYQLPEVTFAGLVLSLNASALVHLGELPMPETDETQKDLVIAKHAIDTLSLLKNKTKGNLTKDEEGLLDAVLYELHMKFIKASS